MKHWISTCVALLLAAPIALAQEPAARDPSGHWELAFDSRSVPRANLQPAVAFEDWCDASDPLERQSIVPPVQR